MMIAAGQVQGEKALGSNQCVKGLLHPWKRVGITDCLCIEPAIAHTEADAAVFLADDDHWWSIKTMAFDDDL